jgi:hypothetical protein
MERAEAWHPSSFCFGGCAYYDYLWPQPDYAYNVYRKVL